MKNLQTLLLSLSISALLTLSACSPNSVDDAADIKNSDASELAEEEVQVAEPIIEPTVVVQEVALKPVPEKQDLVDLLGWFEEGCGFGQYMTDGEPVPSAIDQRYESFKQSFMTQSYTFEDEPIATVTRDYQLPESYREVVEDITVDQNADGVSYMVNFKNATYRGYDLDKLEVFYAPESDFLFDVLYFQNDDFMALKPRFKAIEDMNSDDLRIGKFDAEKRLISCYLGL